MGSLIGVGIFFSCPRIYCTWLQSLAAVSFFRCTYKLLSLSFKSDREQAGTGLVSA